MTILKWAAVAVTALFALMNLGALFDADVETPYRAVAAVLGLAGVAAAAGLGFSQPWGTRAVIAVGALNVATAITGLFSDQQGAVIGIVVGGLGVALGALTGEPKTRMAAQR